MTLCSSVFRSGLQDVELSSLTVPWFIDIIVVHELSDLVQLSSCIPFDSYSMFPGYLFAYAGAEGIQTDSHEVCTDTNYKGSDTGFS